MKCSCDCAVSSGYVLSALRFSETAFPTHCVGSIENVFEILHVIFFLWFSCQSNYGCNHNDVTQIINYLSNPVSEPHSYHVSTFYVQSTLDLNKCFNTFGNMLIHSLASVVGLTLQLPRKVAKQIISTLGHTNNLGGVQSIDRAVLLKLLSVSNIMKK